MYIALRTFVHGSMKFRKGDKIKEGAINPGYIKKLLEKKLVALEADVKAAQKEAKAKAEAKAEAEKKDKK